MALDGSQEPGRSSAAKIGLVGRHIGRGELGEGGPQRCGLVGPPGIPTNAGATTRFGGARTDPPGRYDYPTVHRALRTDMMDRVADKFRSAAASVGRALTLTAVIAGVTIVVVRRSASRQQAASAQAISSTSAQAPEDAAPEQAGSVSAPLLVVARPSRRARLVAFGRRGITATVVVLAAMGAVAAAFGFWLLPETTVPEPVTSSVEMNFGAADNARSPMTVDIRLMLDRSNRPNRASGAALAIDLEGADLARPGWSLIALVPKGVRVDAPSARVMRSSATTDLVTIGAERPVGAAFTAVLEWDDLDSGSVQVRGANVAAAFPAFRVQNSQIPGAGADVTPQPVVSVARHLQLTGDYAVVGGLPPDQLGPFRWTWEAASGRVNDLGLVDAMTVVARSATEDQRAHSSEIRSGIAFGIAAAAMLSAVQEFLNAAKRA